MFAVLHVADFALHAVLRTEPEVTGKAAALFSGTSKKSLVLAANSPARRAGVELGMTAPQAVARCAQLVIRAPKPEAETEARAGLLAVGFTLSPTVEDTAAGICTLEVSGHDPRTLEIAAQAALRELRTLALPATAGIAPTPLLALYAARTAAENEVLQIRDVGAFLRPLPLATADPSPELAAVLANWGLRTLGDLTALPRDEIVRRFGAAGLALWQRAAGGAPRPLRPVVPPQVFEAQMEVEHEIETLEPLLFILRRFLDRLTLELRASQHVAVEMHFRLRLEDDTAYVRSFRLPEPTADPEILFRTLHTHLESVQTAASIVSLTLQLTPARPLVRQQGLFDTGLRDPHGFAETLARVSALVGADRVGTPRREDTHRPDAVQLVPPPGAIPSPAAPVLHAAQGLTLRRYRPPLRVECPAHEGRTYLWSNHVRGEIAARHGPYPQNGDWWEAGRAWTRIEWDIVLAEGGLYRLAEIDGQHFLAGEYD